MGWFNRLCIRQLKRAIPIARERVREATLHGNVADIVHAEKRVDRLKSQLSRRGAIERDEIRRSYQERGNRS